MDILFDPKQWYPSPDRVVSPRPWFLPLTLSACIGSTMLPRKTRVALAVPALSLLASQIRVFSTGDNVKDFSRASFIFGFVLKFIDFGILKRDGEVYKVKNRNASIKKIGSTQELQYVAAIDGKKSIWTKFKDSAELWLFTLRGIGWNWEVGGIPGRQPQSTIYFLFRTLLRIFGSYLAWDICKHAMGQFSYIQSTNRGSFFDEPIINQVILTWLHQLEAFCFINLPYQIGALLTVATRFQTPEDWPPLFGDISDGYLVSRAWGRVWHQLLRRPLGILTPYAQRWLGVTSRGAKRTVSLLSSFTMSGFVHWSGALNCPWTPSSHALLKCIGYFWTISWISFSMRYAARYQFEHGALSAHEPFKNSLIDILVAKLKN
ncbi:hypothetical protein ONS95_000089 [Cadophora gregata]|uniref:uncharacterized protein n=1 Tax=Cadophora gregata TaxID=51156 RepID=UPI0026DD5C1E|nr:uncharacterized protein ONS95_000089 [Cadophora gregata]KAK0128104.1 hypothetical protein ONS95_000089 [Cadophora gregata]